MVATAYFFQDIAHLVYPAALMQRSGIDGLDGCGQPGTTIGDNQQQLLALQSAAIQILQQTFPGALAFAFTAHKDQELPGTVGPYSVSHQHVHPLSARRPSQYPPAAPPAGY